MFKNENQKACLKSMMIAFIKRSFIFFNAIVKEIAKVSEEDDVKPYKNWQK